MAAYAMQMHVRQWRGVLWVATAGVVAWAGWNLWTIVQRDRSGAYEPRDSSVFSKLIGEAAGSIDQGEVKVASWSDYGKLVSCPINGYVPKAPEPPKPTEAPGEQKLPKKPLTDVIKVMALTSAPDDLGRVVVKYKDDTVKPLRDELVIGVGGQLTYPYDGEPYNGRLKTIRADAAVFDWCGDEVEIGPLRKEDGPKEPIGPESTAKVVVDAKLSESEAEALATHKNSERTVTLPNDGGYVIGTKDQSDLAANAENYLREARLTEQKNADGKRELVVGNIRTNSYLGKTYGVQTGDTLISINGEPVSTKAQAYTYVRENQELSKYVVVLRRKGREVTKTILVNREKS